MVSSSRMVIARVVIAGALGLLSGCVAVPAYYPSSDYYAAPAPYYAPPPVYYARPPVYYGPTFGFGISGGYSRGGYGYHRHYR